MGLASGTNNAACRRRDTVVSLFFVLCGLVALMQASVHFSVGKIINRTGDCGGFDTMHEDPVRGTSIRRLVVIAVNKDSDLQS